MSMVKEKVKDILRPIKRGVQKQINYKVFSVYGQEGEDLVIDSLLGKKKKGFFVDVGAYHPVRISNTFRFYKRGWSGINIDPVKENIDLFKKHRKRDINLQVAISDVEGVLDFFEYGSDGSGSSVSKEYNEAMKSQGAKPLKVSKVRTVKLSRILDEYVGGRHIDLLTIDTEGHDLEVLKSSDWVKYKPTVICLESWRGFERYLDFLSPFGYEVAKRSGGNTIFVRKGVKE